MKQRSDLHSTHQTALSRGTAVSRAVRRSKVVLPANDQNADLASLLRAVRKALADDDRAFLARHDWSPAVKKKYAQYLKKQDAWREDLYKNEGFNACLHGFLTEYDTDRKALVAAAKKLTVVSEGLKHFVDEHSPNLPNSHKWFADREKASASRKALLVELDQLAVRFPQEAKILRACREQCSAVPLELIDASTWWPNLLDPANRQKQGPASGAWRSWIARDLVVCTSQKTINRAAVLEKLLIFIAPGEEWCTTGLVAQYIKPVLKRERADALAASSNLTSRQYSNHLKERKLTSETNNETDVLVLMSKSNHGSKPRLKGA